MYFSFLSVFALKMILIGSDLKFCSFENELTILKTTCFQIFSYIDDVIIEELSPSWIFKKNFVVGRKYFVIQMMLSKPKYLVKVREYEIICHKTTHTRSCVWHYIHNNDLQNLQLILISRIISHNNDVLSKW